MIAAKHAVSVQAVAASAIRVLFVVVFIVVLVLKEALATTDTVHRLIHILAFLFLVLVALFVVILVVFAVYALSKVVSVDEHVFVAVGAAHWIKVVLDLGGLALVNVVHGLGELGVALELFAGQLDEVALWITRGSGRG